MSVCFLYNKWVASGQFPIYPPFHNTFPQSRVLCLKQGWLPAHVQNMWSKMKYESLGSLVNMSWLSPCSGIKTRPFVKIAKSPPSLLHSHHCCHCFHGGIQHHSLPRSLRMLVAVLSCHWDVQYASLPISKWQNFSYFDSDLCSYCTH